MPGRPPGFDEAVAAICKRDAERLQLKNDMQQAFARAIVREGLEDNTVLEFCDGDIMTAAEILEIDLPAEVKALREERENKRVNDAMDAADAADKDEYTDLDDIISRFPAM